ncbi:MAG TPA: 1-acyl-sn-glycerol-3-phosphate acyltransferase [Rhodospirillaceae bacterium]|nr:1-acyl-sn-glycerol-3-phosphate acyltransferase [Rhodospirillaceae bacterium]
MVAVAGDVQPSLAGISQIPVRQVKPDAWSLLMEKIELWVRSILFNLVFLFWVTVPTILFVWIVLLPQSKVVKVIRYWQATFAWLAKTIAGIDYVITGWKHVPHGACIIAAKHQSAWETCVLNVLFHDPAIVLKKELTYIPVWGWFAKASGLIPIDRKGGAKSLLIMKKAASDAIKAGRKIVIFPQGTRVKPHTHKPYKVGVAAMYQDLKLPVVPMALNSGLFWPKGAFLKKKGIVTIEFLPAIPPGLTRSALMRKLEEQLETASDRLAREAISCAAKKK